MEGVPLSLEFIECCRVGDLDRLGIHWSHLDQEAKLDHLKVGLEFAKDKSLLPVFKWLLEQQETVAIDISRFRLRGIHESLEDDGIQEEIARYISLEADFYSHCQGNDSFLIEEDLAHSYFKVSYYEKGFMLAIENVKAFTVSSLLESPLKDTLSQEVLSKALVCAVSSDHPMLIANIIRNTIVDLTVNEHCAIKWAIENKDRYLLELILDSDMDLSAIKDCLVSDHLHIADGGIALTLLSDSRFDPGVNDSIALCKAVEAGNTQVLSLLLAHPMVDPLELSNVLEYEQSFNSRAVAKVVSLIAFTGPLLWHARAGNLSAFEGVNFRSYNKDAIGVLLLAACMGGHAEIVKILSPNLTSTNILHQGMLLALCFDHAKVARALFEMSKDCRSYISNLHTLNKTIKKANLWHAADSLQFLSEILLELEPILRMLWDRLDQPNGLHHYIDAIDELARLEFRNYPSVQKLVNHCLSSLLFERHLVHSHILPHEIEEHIFDYLRANFGD